MKASDLFLRCLEGEGVEFIFGVPGEENADIMMSLLDSPIEFITCRHEQGAAFMADLHGRLTGKPGVCLSTLGPGATNLVTGVANAHFDRSPVVAITGQGATTRLHKESHQTMDAVELFGRTSHVSLKNPDLAEVARAFGAFGRRVRSVDNLVPALREAASQEGRPSVVVVPVDYSENMALTRRLGQVIAH